MLDTDLAAHYQVETKTLNRAVKRKSKGSPADRVQNGGREKIRTQWIQPKLPD